MLCIFLAKRFLYDMHVLLYLFISPFINRNFLWFHRSRDFQDSFKNICLLKTATNSGGKTDQQSGRWEILIFIDRKYPKYFQNITDRKLYFWTFKCSEMNFWLFENTQRFFNKYHRITRRRREKRWKKVVDTMCFCRCLSRRRLSSVINILWFAWRRMRRCSRNRHRRTKSQLWCIK